MKSPLKFLLGFTLATITLILFVYLFFAQLSSDISTPLTPKSAPTQVQKLEQELDANLTELDSQLNLLEQELNNF